MSHFYGTAQGNRGEVTRTGSKNSGIETFAASFRGAVRVKAYERDGEDRVFVQFTPWHGHGKYIELYDGPIAPTPDELAAGIVRPEPVEAT